MTNCKKCGTKLEDYFDFCPECGTKIIEENSANIYEADMEKMKKYGIYNPAIYVPTLLKGLVLIFIGILLTGFILSNFYRFDGILKLSVIIGIVIFIVGLKCTFNSKKHSRNSMIIKQTRLIKVGMDIQQIRAMFAFMEPTKEGFTRDGNYILNYSTENGKHSDYESVTVVFDSNAKVIDHSVGYRRTTTYYT